MSAGYSVVTAGAVAIVANTAKTILAVIAAANAPLRLTEAAVSFDGVSSTAVPVFVELCKSTQAGAGTTTAQTPVQVRGATRAVQGNGARNYSAEPTVLSAIKGWYIHPQTGATFQLPLGREVESAGAGALCLRLTAQANVNATGYMEFEEG